MFPNFIVHLGGADGVASGEGGVFFSWEFVFLFVIMRFCLPALTHFYSFFQKALSSQERGQDGPNCGG